MKPLTLVYLTGSGRSGSTLVDRALGAFPGAASLNEIYGVVEQGFVHGWACSCGRPFRDCDFWRRVMAAGLGDVPPRRVMAWAARFDRSRAFPRLDLGLLGPGARRELAAYRAFLGRFLRVLAAETGADVLVDSSKVPGRALVLAGLEGVDLRIVHLVRDPRAVAYAWRRQKHDPGRAAAMDRYGLTRTMAFWAGRQLIAERLARRLPTMRLRYEDFASAPREWLERLAAFVPALSGRPLPMAAGSGDVLELPALHTLSGNPDRFRHGPTPVRLDEHWRDSALAPSLERAFRLVRPLARRYGYA